MNLLLALTRTALVAQFLLGAAWAQQPPPDPDFHQGGIAWLAGDHATAFNHFRLAAHRGDLHGQYNLAIMLMLGEASPPSPREGVFWLKEAAAGGLARAQHDLAEHYRLGRHVKSSPSKAVQWHTRAAGQGWVESRKKLRELLAPAQARPVRH